MGGISIWHLIWIVPLVVIYLTPALVAYGRNHVNTMAITALNILLGWTFLGWAAAFVWALTANTKTGR